MMLHHIFRSIAVVAVTATMLTLTRAFIALFRTLLSIAVVAVTASVLTLTAISVERFAAIVFPLKGRWTAGTNAAIIAVTWLLAAAVASPHLFVRRMYQQHWKDRHEVWCAEQWPLVYKDEDCNTWEPGKVPSGFECVCACVRACACVRVRACVRAYVRVCVCVCDIFVHVIVNSTMTRLIRCFCYQTVRQVRVLSTPVRSINGSFLTRSSGPRHFFRIRCLGVALTEFSLALPRVFSSF